MSDFPFITPFDGHHPEIAENAFVDISARIIGKVEILSQASVWPGAVLRADDDRIVLGQGSAVLDQALVEAPVDKPVLIGDRSLISHQVCVHGATVKAGALIGIGAIVLDQAVIGEGSLIGAGALIPPGMEVPPGVLVLGQPGKVIRELKPAEAENIKAQVQELIDKSAVYLGG